MSEYVECVAKVMLTAEDPLWRRICRIAAQHGERPEELVGFLAGVGIREHLRKVPLCTGGAGAGRAGRYLRRLHDPGRHRGAGAAGDGPHGGGDRHLCGGELSGDHDGPPGIKKGPYGAGTP